VLCGSIIVVAEGFDELRVIEFGLRTFASAAFKFWIGRVESVLWFEDTWVRMDGRITAPSHRVGAERVESLNQKGKKIDPSKALTTIILRVSPEDSAVVHVPFLR
jgi:hypothetical protein